MTAAADRRIFRNRLYEAYASQHAGTRDGRVTAIVYRRDIRPLLPPASGGPVIDLGCGQGALVALMLADGYDASGIDVSSEQVALAHAAGVDAVRLGDFVEGLAECHSCLAAVTATDFLEHLAKDEVLAAADAVTAALMPGGVFVARVPNAVSPTGGHVRYGDFTHETWYTARSLHQIAAAAGFGSVVVRACPPVVHGAISALRVVAWKPVSGWYKLALAAETGRLRGHIVTQNLMFAARKPW